MDQVVFAEICVNIANSFIRGRFSNVYEFTWININPIEQPPLIANDNVNNKSPLMINILILLSPTILHDYLKETLEYVGLDTTQNI